MNLAKFDTRSASEEGQWLDILDWDWETKIGFRVKVLGPDSMVAARINDEEEKAFQAKLAAAYAKGAKSTSEDSELLSVEKAVSKAVKLTVAWEGAEWEGDELPFNEKNAAMLYTQCSHIRTQVLAFYNQKANFTKGESKGSAPSSSSASNSTTRAKKAR